MRLFPVCLNIQKRLCIVVGGGKVAERKVNGLLACGGSVRVISPALTPGLTALHAAGQIAWTARAYMEGDLAGAFLVIAATDDGLLHERIFAESQKSGILINVADTPPLCTFTLPALVRKGDLTVAIATGGKSPALAKSLRVELEGRFGPEYEHLLNLLGHVRGRVLAEGRPQEENEALFTRLLHPEILDWVRDGKWQRISDHLKNILGQDYSVATVSRLARGGEEIGVTQ